MAINYELRKGVLLQEFGYPEMACTNDTLTDELAQWHLSRHPEKAELFSRTPGTIPPPAPAVIQIFQPAPPVVVIPPVIIPPKIEVDIVDSIKNVAGIDLGKTEYSIKAENISIEKSNKPKRSHKARK